MKAATLILAVTMLSWTGTPAVAAPRLMVHLSKCSGPELKGDQVLVIDVSASFDPQGAMERELEERNLVAIRARTVGSIRNFKSALVKAARKAGKERCDAVIVLRKGSDKPPFSPQSSCGMRGTGASFSVSMSEEWLEVVFAERKAVPGGGEKNEG